MIVERLEAHERDGALERCALVRFRDTEVRLRVAVPSELAGDPYDASPFLPLALLSAMQLQEDLVVDAPVSPRLLVGAARARELYRAWCPRLRASEIEVAEERESRATGTEIGCFFSRGVDSTYSAAVPRGYPGPISRLVFIAGFDPEHDDRVRAEEVRRARAAAKQIGLPLSVASTNLYELMSVTVGDADDHTAAALALTGLALAGGLRMVVVPSGDRTQTLGPQGTSPVLDPLFSTEAVALEHDSVAFGRVDKCRWLARERPDLLAELKVCVTENRPDNCGRCSKCLLTMGSLRAAGALEAARQFPDEIDPESVRALRMSRFQPRIEWAELAKALEGGQDPDLRRAVLDALARPQRPYPGLPPREDTPAFGARHDAVLVATIRDRLPWPPSEPAPPPGLALMRAVDLERGRHVYGVGRVPRGEGAAELGSLPRDEAEAMDPVWMTSDGYLTAGAIELEPRRAPRSGAIRWAVAPLFWRDVEEPITVRALAVAARLVTLARPRPAPAGPAARVAYIHRDAAPHRRPLLSSIHPATGDQLLTTNPWEANDMGYAEPVTLGYLDSYAPVTGELGGARRRVPWASRFGQRVRDADGALP